MAKRDFWRAEAQAAEVLATRKLSALPIDPFGIAMGEGIVCEKLKWFRRFRLSLRRWKHVRHLLQRFHL